MRPRTIDELDALDDSVFHDLAHAGPDTPVTLTEDDRNAMREAYARMVDSTDADIRNLMQPADELTDWGLYASLRMNGVDFRSAPAPRI